MDNSERDRKISEHDTQIAVHGTKIQQLEGKVAEQHDSLYREEGVVELLHNVALLQHECRRRDAAQPAQWQTIANMAAVIIALIALLWGVFGGTLKRGIVEHGTTASIIQCR